AAVGISEATDSMTIVVSEETGRITLAEKGTLTRINDAETLRKTLSDIKDVESGGGRFRIWKGRLKDERKTDQ
ncbi:MAG: DNA integrity scanning protein DisA nucleotide-binding domain protein, partial [Hungatella sp.]